MPKEMETALARQADKKGLRGEKKSGYIYGAMRKRGKLKKKSRGVQAEAVEGKGGY